MLTSEAVLDKIMELGGQLCRGKERTDAQVEMDTHQLAL